jgi:hypothetical protein
MEERTTVAATYLYWTNELFLISHMRLVLFKRLLEEPKYTNVYFIPHYCGLIAF